jgi:hypothetical protein
MPTPSRYRVITNRIPRVLVIIYFCRGLSKYEQKEVNILDIHREKIRTSTPKYSRRLEKTPPERWGPPAIGQGRAPHLSRMAARGQKPISFNLTDPASTDFKD